MQAPGARRLSLRARRARWSHSWRRRRAPTSRRATAPAPSSPPTPTEVCSPWHRAGRPARPPPRSTEPTTWSSLRDEVEGQKVIRHDPCAASPPRVCLLFSPVSVQLNQSSTCRSSDQVPLVAFWPLSCQVSQHPFFLPARYCPSSRFSPFSHHPFTLPSGAPLP